MYSIYVCVAPYIRNQLYLLRSESRYIVFPSNGSNILKVTFLNTTPQVMIKIRRYLDYLQERFIRNLLVQLS